MSYPSVLPSSDPAWTEVLRQTLFDTINAVQQAIKNIPELRKRSSAQQRRLFATDLTLVAISLRTSYLVDVYAPQDPVRTFTQLLTILREEVPFFKDVIHMFDPTSGQSFFTNAPMLRDRLEKATEHALQHANKHPGIASDDIPAFVLLVGFNQYELLPTTPPEILTLLSYLHQQCTFKSYPEDPNPLSISLPPGTPPQTTVPLAAFLLEYAIAYVPASATQTSNLNNVLLDVHECVATMDLQSEWFHTVLRFSCPSEFADEHPDVLDSVTVMSQLMGKYIPRLSKYAIPVRIFHMTDTLQHIAL